MTGDLLIEKLEACQEGEHLDAKKTIALIRQHFTGQHEVLQQTESALDNAIAVVNRQDLTRHDTKRVTRLLSEAKDAIDQFFFGYEGPPFVD